jgi:hypothetical protein
LAPTTGAESDGETSVNAEAGAEEIASIAAPAKAAANPPTRIRLTMIASVKTPSAPRDYGTSAELGLNVMKHGRRSSNPLPADGERASVFRQYRQCQWP